jgi:hypothetical protein
MGWPRLPENQIQRTRRSRRPQLQVVFEFPGRGLGGYLAWGGTAKHIAFYCSTIGGGGGGEAGFVGQAPDQIKKKNQQNT